MLSQCPALFEAQGIEKKFGGVTALSDVNIKIFKGKICGLLGANGSGKSTLSKIVTGIYQPTNGQLLHKGSSVSFQNPTQAVAKNIAMVHQHLSLIPDLTVWQNICLGIENQKKGGFLDDIKSRERATDYLRKFSESISPFDKVINLSPAEKQIVEIVKALYKEPEILILDEPTAALEQKEVRKLFDVLVGFKSEMAMIFISHRMKEVFEICDYVTIFRNGNSVGDIDFKEEDKNEEKIISLMTGKETRTSDSNAISSELRIKETQFEVRNLSLPGVLDSINFKVKKGEIIGISGLQGQGQEELLLVLAGFMKRKSGSFIISGREISFKHPKEALASGIVLVPGDRNEEGLFTEHSILDNLIYPQFSGKKHRGILDKAGICKQADDIMSRLSVVARDRDQIISELSGGNQQKVVVGKWLALNPTVLLLSDPAKGVDVPAKIELYNVVQELASSGSSVVVFASDNSELIDICDRILVMFEGKIVQNLENHCLTDEILVTHGLHMNSECLENDND